MKTSYLNSEIYSKLNGAAVNKNKSTQHRKSLFVKTTILILKAVVALKEHEKQVKREI